MRENGTLFWVLSDHLGSTRVLAASGGSQDSWARYKAWGETRAGSITRTSYHFTGQIEGGVHDLWQVAHARLGTTTMKTTGQDLQDGHDQVTADEEHAPPC